MSFGLCFVYYRLVCATVQRRDFRAGLGAFWSTGSGLWCFSGQPFGRAQGGRHHGLSSAAGRQCRQHACMYVCAYMRICIHAYMHVCMCAYMHVCTCGRVVVCVCMCVCMYACMYACMHVVKSCKSHKVQSSHVSHTRCSQVKSCESARVSAETVSGGSVVAVDVGRKDGIAV